MFVTAQFIDKNWNMKSVIINFDLFYTSRIGEAVEAFIGDFFEKSGISQCVEAVTIDRVSNMKS